MTASLAGPGVFCPRFSLRPGSCTRMQAAACKRSRVWHLWRSRSCALQQTRQQADIDVRGFAQDSRQSTAAHHTCLLCRSQRGGSTP